MTVGHRRLVRGRLGAGDGSQCVHCFVLRGNILLLCGRSSCGEAEGMEDSSRRTPARDSPLKKPNVLSSQNAWLPIRWGSGRLSYAVWSDDASQMVRPREIAVRTCGICSASRSSFPLLSSSGPASDDFVTS